MDSLSEMRSAVQSDLNASGNSSLFPPDTIDDVLNRAYIKIAGFVRWPDLEDAKTTTTQLNQEYYDVPDTWRYNSVWRITVNGDLYGEEPDGSPLDFKDYLEWKDENTSSTLKKWAQYRNQIFIYPTPTAAGVEIVAWGQRTITEMTVDGSTTIFSENMPEVNEAIVLEAEAILRRKGEADDKGQLVSTEAKTIVLTAFDKVKKEKSKYEKVQAQFNVPDFFGKTASEENIGNFADYD